MQTLFTMKKIFTLLFFSLFTNLFSQTNNWTYVGENVSNAKFYIKEIGNPYFSSSCWVKCYMPAKSYRNKEGKLVKRSSPYLIERWEISCDFQQISRSSSILYNSDGTVKASSNNYSPSEYVTPDSMGESILNYMCAAKY